MNDTYHPLHLILYGKTVDPTGNKNVQPNITYHPSLTLLLIHESIWAKLPARLVDWICQISRRADTSTKALLYAVLMFLKKWA